MGNKMSIPEPSSVYRLHPDVAIEDFDDRSLALHCSKIQLVELNATARDALKKMDGRASIADIARAMIEEYDTTLEIMLADLQEIVAELHELELVEAVDQGEAE